MVTALFVQVELPPPDLGPSSALSQTLTLLRDILASHDSSVIPLDARQADFVQVVFKSLSACSPPSHTLSHVGVSGNAL